MQTMPGSPTASFHEDGIVFRRTIAGNDVNLAFPAKRFLHEIQVFDDTRIHGGHFAGMMTPEYVVEVVQRRKIVVSSFIAIPNAQPLIGVHVIE
ncbi:MAG: hypothetical protein K0S79_1360 [Nitrospira sp.]|nr:hypothetical protein [Nitrospira sp.]